MTRSRGWMLYLLLWVLAVLAVLYESRMGRLATPVLGVDWAHHMSLVESFYADSGRDPRAAAHLGEFGAYPGWSHWAVALLAQWCGIRPLAAMQIWVGILSVTGCFLIALRLVRPLAPGGIFLSGFLLATGALLAATFLCVNLPGHIRVNFFFAQLLGMVVAIGLHMIVEGISSSPPVWPGLVIVAGAVVTANIHLTPAVWFVAASTLALLAGSASFRRGLVACAVALGLVAALWAANPAVWKMIELGQSPGGDFVIRTGVVRSMLWPLFAVACAGMLALQFLPAIRRNTGDSWRRILRRHSGLLAVLGLMLVQFGYIVVTQKGDTYRMAKYLYFLAMEIPLLLVYIRIPRLDRMFDGFELRSGLLAGLIMFGACFLLQVPYPPYPYDQTALIQASDSLRTQRTQLVQGEQRYPEFEEFTPPMNYYLAIAILRLPRDDRTENWFVQKGARGEPALPRSVLQPLEKSQ